MGDPKPLADTLRKHEGAIPQDVREALADALLRGPVRTKRTLNQTALNYLYKAATILEAAKKAGVRNDVIQRWRKEALEHVASTTGTRASSVNTVLGRFRRQVRNSVMVELQAAGMKPRNETRRYGAGQQARAKAQKKNLPMGPNSVFALGLRKPDM